MQEFPPTSTLDPSKYGNHISSIREADIIHNLEGLTIEQVYFVVNPSYQISFQALICGTYTVLMQALSNSRLFILDHHDGLMPYMNRINSTSNKIYATRTLLFLKDDSTLKPLAIELSLPHPDGEQYGAVNKVFTPADVGVEGSFWQLAKAYVAVNDYGIHQLSSHW